MKRRYICTDTVTGVLSAIYDAWLYDRKDTEAGIVFWGSVQQEMFCEYCEVKEEEIKAAAVHRLIRNHLGEEAETAIGYALLSEDPGKGTAVLRTMIEAQNLPEGKRIMGHLSHPAVQKVFELSRNVSRESHAWTEFLRFRELSGGILYAGITPRNFVLPSIADHFSNRFPLENFVICDETHCAYLLHPKQKSWIIFRDEERKWEIEASCSSQEEEWQRLWKGFKKSVTIQERKNRKLQQMNMPLRYRSGMSEYQDVRGKS